MRNLITCIILIVLTGTSMADTGVELPKNSPIPIVVEQLSKDALDIGLTEDLIRSKVELQFRRNGIQPAAGDPKSIAKGYFVYVRVSVAKSVFALDIGFHRNVTYTVLGQDYSTGATTYDKSAIGVHGGDSSYVISKLLEGVDLLSNEILKSRK